MMLVKKEDVVSAGFCKSGLKDWMKSNGFTSADLMDGIEAEVLLATGCDLAAKVVEAARLREEK